jgi:hypothetical protein
LEFEANDDGRSLINIVRVQPVRGGVSHGERAVPPFNVVVGLLAASHIISRVISTCARRDRLRCR